MTAHCVRSLGVRACCSLRVGKEEDFGEAALGERATSEEGLQMLLLNKDNLWQGLEAA